MDSSTFPNLISLGTIRTSNLTVAFCFAAGTQIATGSGERAGETLTIGDQVLAEDGRSVPVKWIGRQMLNKSRHGQRMQPVGIRVGALGQGPPHRDLTLTTDHGLTIDGLVVNAAAFVNRAPIDFAPSAELGDSFVVYHVET